MLVGSAGCNSSQRFRNRASSWAQNKQTFLEPAPCLLIHWWYPYGTYQGPTCSWTLATRTYAKQQIYRDYIRVQTIHDGDRERERQPKQHACAGKQEISAATIVCVVNHIIFSSIIAINISFDIIVNNISILLLVEMTKLYYLVKCL